MVSASFGIQRLFQNALRLKQWQHLLEGGEQVPEDRGPGQPQAGAQAGQHVPRARGHGEPFQCSQGAALGQ